MGWIVCSFFSIIVWVIGIFFDAASAKKISLFLYNDRIEGSVPSKTVQLPIDKNNSIEIRNGYSKKWKIVAIRSSTDLVLFRWVHNAEEFVNATLAKMEEYKHTASSAAPTASPSVNQASAAGQTTAKIKELKELLDSGLITQEEFEAKRQELLKNM